MIGMPAPFWETTSLADMTEAQWESLCDGCALCCVHKLEDDDSGDVYFSNLACRLLDTDTCRCSDYPRRAGLVPDCLQLREQQPQVFRWLPASCAYRRLYEGKSLPDWHPLITGDPGSVHAADVSVRGKVLSERETSDYTALQQLTPLRD